jgi:N-acetylmuramoyl-L-alanine amidase
MRVVRHRLVNDNGSAVDYEPSPNRGSALEPRYLIMHYTAGRSVASSISWLCNPAAGASAHLVIGTDGSITQLVPFNRVAWHAGTSSWYDISGMNQCSIGIELDNPGKLVKQDDNWRSWFGETYDDDKVIEETHKYDSVPAGWLVYRPEQIEAAVAAAVAICRRYKIRDVLGHDDIAPERKRDPGPAFIMGSFRGQVLGRQADDPQISQTLVNLNIRYGPGTEYDKVRTPLPKGTKVEVLDHYKLWSQVLVLDELDGDIDIEGWVCGRYLSAPTSLSTVRRGRRAGS